MVDLNMLPGLTDDQRRQWLREVGADLAEETGQPSGQTEKFENADGETSWIMWWTDEDYTPVLSAPTDEPITTTLNALPGRSADHRQAPTNGP